VIYGIAQLVTNVTVNTASMDVACSANTRARLLQFSFTSTFATSNQYGINRPSAIGTRTAPVALIAQDSADTTQTGVDSAIAWSVTPTLATNDLFRGRVIGTSFGNGFDFYFPSGISIAASGSLVFVLRNALQVVEIGIIADI
jgi:hypothetical protein